MSNSSLTADQRSVYESTTPVISFTLRDENDAVVPAASLTTLTLTVFDVSTSQIINSRDDSDALNTGNVTVSAGGVVVYSMPAADNPIVGSIGYGQTETHAVHFRWTWASGAKAGEHLIELLVVSRDHVG